MFINNWYLYTNHTGTYQIDDDESIFIQVLFMIALVFCILFT